MHLTRFQIMQERATGENITRPVLKAFFSQELLCDLYIPGDRGNPRNTIPEKWVSMMTEIISVKKPQLSDDAKKLLIRNSLMHFRSEVKKRLFDKSVKCTFFTSI